MMDKTRAPERRLVRFVTVLLLLLVAETARGQSLLDGFDPNANGKVNVVVVQPDGKILIGGDFTTLSPNGGAAIARNRIARVNPDGTLDVEFDPNANSSVTSIALQADGKILAGGSFTSIGGQPRNRIARLDATTGSADAFDANATDAVLAIALQADGKIVAGGFFTNIGGQQRSRLARLDPASALADSFDPNPAGGGVAIHALKIQADGNILVGGFFNSIGGQARSMLARVNPVTGAADSFDPQASDEIRCIAVQADGKVLAGGFFNLIGGQSRTDLARLDPTTGAADTFNPNPTGGVFALALQTDGKILVGGEFFGIGGQSRHFIARLDSTTGLADSVNPNPNSSVFSMAVQADGKILLGGFFLTVSPNGGAPVTRGRIARFLEGPMTTPTPTPTSTPTSTPTATASPTTTPSPTATPTASPTPIVTATPTPTVTASPIVSPTPTPTPTATTTPTATPSATPTATANPTPTASPTPSPTATPGSLGNISTRLRVLSGDNALIGGMIATGTANKKIIIRAIGPTLSDFGVPGALQDPTLELYQGSTLIASNDDWRQSTQQAEIQNSGLAPSKDAESTIIATLTPNQNYTAIVCGKNGTTGVGVVEAFDLDQGAPSKLGNISTRGFVDVDDKVMIAGLIVTPSDGTTTKILVRVLGPTLGDFGVPSFLADPTLELVNSSGTTIRSNDNWKSSQRPEIEASNLAPSHDEEAALIETVAPGAYTAIVRGSGRTTGVGLVEVYNIQ